MPAVPNKQSAGIDKNLESSARPFILTNCLPWGGASKDGRLIIHVNTNSRYY